MYILRLKIQACLVKIQKIIEIKLKKRYLIGFEKKHQGKLKITIN